MKKSDSETQRDVMAELEWYPGVDHSGIGLAAVDGVVALTGFAGSYATKLAVEGGARRVVGVNAMEWNARVSNERRLAKQAVWGAPSVVQIDKRILVSP